jgi:hypothetical protein
MAKPPGAGVSELVAFSLIDGLIRGLVARNVISSSDAADLISGVVEDVRLLKLAAGRQAIPVLEEMLDEYRK